MEKENEYCMENAECVRATDMALLIASDELDGVEWCPRSVVSEDSDVQDEGDTGILVVSGWFARQKGWS